MILLGASLLAVIAVMVRPILDKSVKQGKWVQAAKNAGFIGGSLEIFRHEYGSYPCDATRETLREEGHTKLPPGNSANAYLAQLIVSGELRTETFFYAAGNEDFREGDDVMKPGELLKAGENGFLYIMAKEGKSLKSDLGLTPLVMAFVEKRGRYPKFDTKIFAGRYVYAAVDGSVQAGNLSEDGTALSEGRSHLFEAGPNSLFGSQIPVFRYPLGF